VPMRQGIIRQKRGSGQEELPYEAWNSQEVEDISVPFVRHMAFDKQSIVNLYEYWLLATIGGIILTIRKNGITGLTGKTVAMAGKKNRPVLKFQF